MRRIFNSKLFLAICALATISVLTDFNAITLIMALFLWFLYVQCERGELTDVKNMLRISGTVFVMYIVNLVSYIIFAVTVALFGVFISIGLSNMDRVRASFIIGGITGVDLTPDSNMHILIYIVLIVYLALVAAGGIIITVFGVGKIHYFAQSLYLSVSSGKMKFYRPNYVSNWMIVMGVFPLSPLFAVF